MSEARAITNHIGNCVASVVMASWEKEIDWEKFKVEMARGYPLEEIGGGEAVVPSSVPAAEA